MDLKLFFDPVSVEVLNIEIKKSSLGSSIYVNKQDVPDLEGIDLAIIGLKEGRGADPKVQEGIEEACLHIRRELYALKRGNHVLKIVDLGNLRNGPELQDSYLRLKEVCEYLMERNVLPIIIGGSHDMDLGQYFSYQSSDKLVTFLNVDNKLDLEDPAEDLPSASHINRIIRHDPNYLFNYYHLAYQSYLVGGNESDLMEKLGFEALRLGLVRGNMKEMEPVIRDADLLSVDVSAIQSAHAPGAVGANVFGLAGEEACQVCWYAGLNDKLTSLGIYGFNARRDDDNHTTAFLIATMIWYFIEGYYNRKGNKDFRSNDYLIYEVPLGGEPDSIRFYKSQTSEKWWMEVPHPDDSKGFMRSKMVPCSYSDYEMALDGEVPNRWVSTFGKFT